MSWQVGYDERWRRWIGYGVPALCDHPDCSALIDRGLSYVCGDEPYGGESGCGLYFCSSHRRPHQVEESDGETCWRDVCERCAWNGPPFEPKPDHPDWIQHQETDESWAEWRAERTARRASAAQKEEERAD